MKKFLTSIFVVLLVCVSAITMFACDNNADKNLVYQKVEAIMTSIGDEDNGMFVDYTESTGLTSPYGVYPYANSSYNYYNQLFVLPMNYIANYYLDLKDLENIPTITSEGQAAINKLGAAADNFTVAYNTCTDDFATYKNLSDLEGAIIVYRISLKNMIGCAYELANALAEVKDVIFDDFNGLEKTNVALKNKDTQTLRDYAVLQLANEFYKTLIVNLNMKDYTSLDSKIKDVDDFKQVNKSIKTALARLTSLQGISKDSLKDLTGAADEAGEYTNTQVTTILEAMDLMKNESQILAKAQENFSLRLFYESYSCSMDAYTAVSAHASKYYNEITKYYQNYVLDYMTYLTSLIK